MLASQSWSLASFEWQEAEEHLRAFLQLTHRWVTPAFDELWDEIGQRPGDWDSDQADIFFGETGGLWTGLYDWLLHEMLVRDALSAFEIYLEKAVMEVLSSSRLKWASNDGRSPEWNEIVRFLKDHLSVKVETARIKTIRKVRNILTHQRGELHTKELRTRFGGGGDLLPENAIRLSEADVIQIFDDLGKMVRKVDQAVTPYVSGTARITVLTATDEPTNADRPNSDRLPPARVMKALSRSLARWNARGPSNGGDDTGLEMASAITEFLAWSKTI